MLGKIFSPASPFIFHDPLIILYLHFQIKFCTSIHHSEFRVDNSF